MWENTKNKIRLKKNAVPTIFGDLVHQVKITLEIGSTCLKIK